MRHITALLATVLLLAGATGGCSKSGDGTAKDCATALTEQTGGNSADKPTVSEAQERVDAFDDTLAGMVRSGYQGPAKDAADALEEKTKEGGEGPFAEAARNIPFDLDGAWQDEDGAVHAHGGCDWVSLVPHPLVSREQLT